MEGVRIDKWLWAARFFKTRALATEAVLGGRAHVNGVRVKPAKVVRAGDTVEVANGDTRWTVGVGAAADKRGPAKVGATPYEETPASVASPGRNPLERRVNR